MKKWLLVLPLLVLGALVGAQDDDRLDYYGVAMQAEFREDIAAFPNAPSYTLDVTLLVAPDQATIGGQLRVQYTNRSPDRLDDIVFRLYPNLETYGGTLNVATVFVEGLAVMPAYDETRTVIRVPLPQALLPDASTQIEMNFSAKVLANDRRLYNQFSYLNGALALPNFFPLLSVYDEDGWWQTTAHPQGDVVYSETAFFDVRLTAPAELVVITSGDRLESYRNADGTRTHHYVAPLMRDFAVMAARGYESISTQQDGVRIDVHFLPGGDNGALAVRRYATEAVRIFTEHFGPYPYSELDIVETFTSAGGIEYPGLIVIQDDSWNAMSAFLEVVTAHEVAHQWWYGVVGNDQTRHPWLDEALAQYATALYYGGLYSPDTQAETLLEYRNNWQEYIRLNPDRPIGGAVTNYPQNDYFFFVYQKGPLFFATLADTYGEEALLAALSDYFQAHRYAIVTPDDLQSSLETSLGTDLDALFAEWVGE